MGSRAEDERGVPRGHYETAKYEKCLKTILAFFALLCCPCGQYKLIDTNNDQKNHSGGPEVAPLCGARGLFLPIFAFMKIFQFFLKNRIHFG